ncbi:MAG: general secretion pathway protein GspN [Proteobacteria bacterium]|nr:general secretion pathway protein GspN [Pseudomonadota bacterium]
MRIEDASSRTWLLAAVAGWAVIAWVLALVGMGGRVAPLDDDASLLRPLPGMPAASVSPLGPPTQYSEIGARPLFARDRQPRPFLLQGDDGAAAGEFDYVLTSVLLSPRVKLAILQSPENGESVRVRLDQAPESHPAWRLIALGPRSAVFEGPEGRHELELRVYDGVGGQAPTAVSRDSSGRARTDLPIRPPAPSPAADPAQDSASPERPTDAVDTTEDAAASPDADAPLSDQAQMEAIRQRIQARRDQLRMQAPQQAPRPTPPQPRNSPQPPAKSQ